jgi:hypothetical protein
MPIFGKPHFLSLKNLNAIIPTLKNVGIIFLLPNNVITIKRMFSNQHKK